MAALAPLLKRETELVTRFRDMLLREQDILRSGNSDGLAELNIEKLSLAECLNQAGLERTRALSSSGESPIDMQAWFSAHPLEKDAIALWEGMLKIAREARGINEQNGNLINVLHQKTSEALSVLTHTQTNQSFYSSSGQTTPSTGSRIIDSA